MDPPGGAPPLTVTRVPRRLAIQDGARRDVREFNVKDGAVYAALAGMLIALPSLAKLCINLPMGYIVDAVGRKPPMIIGVILNGLGSLATASAKQLRTVALLRGRSGRARCACPLRDTRLEGRARTASRLFQLRLTFKLFLFFNSSVV